MELLANHVLSHTLYPISRQASVMVILCKNANIYTRIFIIIHIYSVLGKH